MDGWIDGWLGWLGWLRMDWMNDCKYKMLGSHLSIYACIYATNCLSVRLSLCVLCVCKGTYNTFSFFFFVLIFFSSKSNCMCVCVCNRNNKKDQNVESRGKSLYSGHQTKQHSSNIEQKLLGIWPTKFINSYTKNPSMRLKEFLKTSLPW